MREKLYNIPPSDKAFNEMKEKSVELFREIYPGDDDYINSKIWAIKKLKNIGDNFMFIFSLFDIWNKRKLLSKLSNETKEEVKKRLGSYYLKLLNL